MHIQVSTHVDGEASAFTFSILYKWECCVLPCIFALKISPRLHHSAKRYYFFSDRQSHLNMAERFSINAITTKIEEWTCEVQVVDKDRPRGDLQIKKIKRHQLIVL